jgi:two-component system, cell cycle response regulator
LPASAPTRSTAPRPLVIGVLVVMAAYGAHALAGVGGEPLAPLFNLWVHDGLFLLAAAACVVTAVRCPPERGAWLCFAVALGTYAAGEILWTTIFSKQDPEPFPSLSDACWLAFYPSTYAGLVLLVRRHVASFSAALWVDGLIGGLVVAALGAALVFQPILDATGGSPLAVAVNLAYPLGDLLIISFVVTIYALTGWRPGRAWLVLGAGFAMNAITDCIYSYQASAGTSQDGGYVDYMFSVAIVLLGFAATQRWDRARRVRTDGMRMLILPGVFALGTFALIVYDHFAGLGTLAFALAMGSLVGIVARAALTFRDNLRMLGRSQRDAETDSLTGLGNRRKLMLDLRAALGPDSESPEHMLLLFDLDGFKQYNDVFGHPAGDALLRRLGENLRVAVAPCGTAYRLGGDEFCALVDLRGQSADAITYAAAVALIEQGEGFAVGCSFGSVLLPADADAPATAIKLADQRMYAQKHGRRSSASRQTRDVLLRVLHERDPHLGEHMRGVAELAGAVARDLGLGNEEVEDVVRAAELHDVGKMGVPEAIVEKPAALDDEEWAFMRRHTLIGERILSAAPALAGVARLVRSSHERFDGTGYPDGLAGEKIPLGSRIVAVCDAYDAMTSARPYRESLPAEAAISELRRCAGTQFDPRVVDSFARVLEAGEAATRAA